MNAKQIIQASMAEVFGVVDLPDGVTVTTQCVYPSNEFVRVSVRAGEGTYYVSDDGRAVQEIENAGADIRQPERQTRQILAPFGLEMQKGAISSPGVSASEVGVAVALVANASARVAEWFFSHLRARPDHQKFKDVVAHYLRNKFRDNVREEILVGGSNKAHSFDNIVVLSGSRRLVVDAVSNDANSINSRFAAHMDIKAASYPDVMQRIVYDDSVDWSAANLNLLSLSAVMVPYSRVPEVLERIAS